jgi:hypothetical protein
VFLHFYVNSLDTEAKYSYEKPGKLELYKLIAHTNENSCAKPGKSRSSGAFKNCHAASRCPT